jgi:hypothetical protein
MEYIVIENHKTDYPNPIIVKTGEEIIIEKEYDGDMDWSNWMFCIKIDGSNKGWIPKQIIKHKNSRNIIVEDYSARELNVEKGNIIEGIQEINGWLWSKNKETNEIGWIPIKKIASIGANMDKREILINKYFQMWINKDVNVIDEIFDLEIVYTECFGPEYHGINQIKKWFIDWNKKGTVLEWKIKQFIHQNSITVVEWFFECNYNLIKSSFDGVSIIKFNNSNKIIIVKEFQSKAEHNFPYENT